MKQIATALLGIGSTLLAGISAPVQSTDLVVNFKTSVSSAETSPQPAEPTADQPTSPPPKGEPAPCIACGMG